MARTIALALLVAAAALAFHLYASHVDSLARGTPSRPPLPPGAPSLVLLEELDALPSQRSDAAANEPPADTQETRAHVTAGDRCLSIGPFEDIRVTASLRDWLRDYIAVINTRVETSREQRFFWVYLEPTTDADAQARLDALAEQGVDDYLLIRRGDLRNAISLGLFRSQDSVNRRLAEMNEKGYKPVVVPRFELSHRIWIEARLASEHADSIEVPPNLLGTAAVDELDCAAL